MNTQIETNRNEHYAVRGYTLNRKHGQYVRAIVSELELNHQVSLMRGLFVRQRRRLCGLTFLVECVRLGALLVRLHLAVYTMHEPHYTSTLHVLTTPHSPAACRIRL
jgi:hypothetical protein